MPVEGTMSTGSESKIREDRTVCRTWASNMMVMIMRRRRMTMMVMIMRRRSMTKMVMIMTMKRMDAEDNDYEDDDEDIVNMMECVT